MSLKSDIFKLFDVYVPPGQSDEVTFKDLDRRGKIDKVKLGKAMIVIADAVEQLQMRTK